VVHVVQVRVPVVVIVPPPRGAVVAIDVTVPVTAATGVIRQFVPVMTHESR
jgi:hypothetical protein